MVLFYRLGVWIRVCFEEGKELVFNPVASSVLATFGIGHMLYAFGTRSEDEIEVSNKYQIYSSSGTHFAIDTTDNRQFLIPYSVWYLQFDVPEKWNKIQKGRKYKIVKYGYRIPALSMFPNIVSIKD